MLFSALGFHGIIVVSLPATIVLLLNFYRSEDLVNGISGVNLESRILFRWLSNFTNLIF